MKERFLFIDLAKTIGIYLVILGHYVWYMDIPFGNTAAVWNMAYFVTLFHMPLFFISHHRYLSAAGYFVRLCKRGVFHSHSNP